MNFNVPRTLLTTQAQITEVGYNKFNFDSRVEVDTLRSLYLVSFLAWLG